MTDPAPAPAAPLGGSPSTGSAREGVINSIAPVSERSKRAKRSPGEAEKAEAEPTRSMRVGDVPRPVEARYYTEGLGKGGPLSFYEGPGAKRVAFRDHGDRLVTSQTHPTVARDLALIAAHRGWATVRVRGEDEFRRQAWLEARALGLEVQGYKPRERDDQELAKRLARTHERSKRRSAPPERPAEPAPDRSPPEDHGPAPTAKGVVLEIGRAPYRRRPGAPLTPFVKLGRAGERPLEVWGARLPEALARSAVEIGDRVAIHRDWVERRERARASRPTPSTERVDPQARRGPADARAERFRRSTSAQKSGDPDLRGAQSHLVVLDTLIDRLVLDPARRARLHAEARDIIAGELAQGRRFPPARVREVEPALARDVAEASRRRAEPDRARAR